MQSQKEHRPTTANDEIDFELLGLRFQKVMMSVGEYMRGLRRKWKKFLFFSLIGVLLGGLLFTQVKRIYQAEITLTKGGQPNSILFERVNSLNRLIKEKETETLSKALGLSPDVCKTIKKISYKNLDPNASLEDSIATNFYFIVNVKTTDPGLFENLPPALINFLESNPYALKQKEIRKANIKKHINNLTKNLEDIDSLKSIIAASLIPRSTGHGLIYGEAPDQVSVIEQGLDLHEKKLYFEDQLDALDIQVVNPFIGYKKPIFPKLKWFVAIGLLLGLIIALFLPSKKT